MIESTIGYFAYGKKLSIYLKSKLWIVAIVQ